MGVCGCVSVGADCADGDCRDFKLKTMCNCIEEYNARLRAKKDVPMLQIDTNIGPDGTERVSVCGVYKKKLKNKEGKRVLSKTWYKFQIPAKYCPFCGQKYELNLK